MTQSQTYLTEKKSFSSNVINCTIFAFYFGCDFVSVAPDCVSMLAGCLLSASGALLTSAYRAGRWNFTWN